MPTTTDADDLATMIAADLRYFCRLMPITLTTPLMFAFLPFRSLLPSLRHTLYAIAGIALFQRRRHAAATLFIISRRRRHADCYADAFSAAIDFITRR